MGVGGPGGGVQSCVDVQGLFLSAPSRPYNVLQQKDERLIILQSD